MLKKLLLKWMLFLYRKDYYRPLGKIEVENLIIKICTTPGLENLPAYLNQCADNAKRQYMYTNDVIFKGTTLAFVTLREQIEKQMKEIDKQNRKKALTLDEKNAIMKKRNY